MIPALEIFLKGIVLGLTVSVPLGPVGILLINRTIKRGVLSGFFSGLGLATADTMLAIMAGLGFTFVIGFIREEKFFLGLIAGVVVILVGVKVFLSNPVKEFRNKDKTNGSLWRDYITVFALSITNPYTILIFVAFFSAIHTYGNIKPELIPFILISGIFVGAISWWLSLSFFVSRFNKKIRLRNIVRINLISGIAIIVIGVIILISVLTTIKPKFV
jgi:threonine/homoserine/homoserine lactone efflux protein